MSHETEAIVFKTVCDAWHRLTPGNLYRKLYQSHGVPRNQVKKSVNRLMAEGALVYSNLFGCTFIEESFSRAVRISDRVVLKPAQLTCPPIPGVVFIDMVQGASFGTGSHPTTRLAVRAIDRTLGLDRGQSVETKGRVIDIGTGSGVLCITAVRLGMDSGLGLDLDPCAISEARENVRVNGLDRQIMISTLPLPAVAEQFFLVTANLRYPTLKAMCHDIWSHTLENGFIVLSGIRTLEAEDLIKTYTRQFFDLIWKFAEKGWVCLVMQKSGGVACRS